MTSSHPGGRCADHLVSRTLDGMNSPILVVIIGCEVGFWVMVFAGMCLRYLLHLRTISTIVLAAVPVLDALLLAAVALDIHQGSTVETVHRLAGVYLGVTVAFGHSVVTWADGWFAHRFADGPAPARGPKKGQAAFRREVRAFGQWMCAATISGITVVGLAQTVAVPNRLQRSTECFRRWASSPSSGC